MPQARKALYYAIMLVAMLLVVELFSRAYYYHTAERHPLAFVQVLKDLKQRLSAAGAADTVMRRVEKAQQIVRPGLSESEAKDIVREQREANQAVYQPWTEFVFRDYHGKYVNVTGGIRRSSPDRSDPSPADTTGVFTIWFLGGSTTYGFGVTDSETIASCFARAYRQSHPNGRPIRVINRGMPFFYSYQELIQLSDLLYRGQKPDMVILLDGLNDCISANNAWRRVPAFAIGKAETYQPGSKDAESRQREASPDWPPGLSIDSGSRDIARYYLDNIRHAHDLAGLYHIPVYCFWQPVPYYNYPNRINDPICTHAANPPFEAIYPIVKRDGAALPYFFFLGDLLQEEKGLPFIDQIHYSPQFSKILAEKMLSLVSP